MIHLGLKHQFFAGRAGGIGGAVEPRSDPPPHAIGIAEQIATGDGRAPAVGSSKGREHAKSWSCPRRLGQGNRHLAGANAEIDAAHRLHGGFACLECPRRPVATIMRESQFVGGGADSQCPMGALNAIRSHRLTGQAASRACVNGGRFYFCWMGGLLASCRPIRCWLRKRKTTRR